MTDYDKFADMFARSRDRKHWPEVDVILEFIAKNCTDEQLAIADIGCGQGRLLQAIRGHEVLSKKGVSYSGLDASEGLIEHARDCIVDSGCESFLVGDMRDMMGKLDQAFDVIIFLASFHHLMDSDERIEVLRQARSLLNPSGYICMTNWNLLSQENLIRYEDCVSEQYDDGSCDFAIKIGEHVRDYHAFTLGSLEDIFTKAGLSLDIHDFSDSGRNIISIVH